MIEFKNVNYQRQTVSKPLDVLKNITVRIEKGSFTCIIGKNGSGKTTFGKIIKGLIKPTSGMVIIDDAPVTGVKDNVGYIFTNPENQIVHPIVEDDIAFGLENLMHDESTIKEKIETALMAVDMQGSLKSSIHWLSSGEQQKIVAAGVIALEHDIIILDEATSMLDGISKNEFMKIVKNLNRQENKTIIFITHDFEDIKFCDSVILLDQGEVVFSGSRETFYENKELQQKYDYEFPEIINLINYYKDNGYMLKYDDINEIAKKLYTLSRDDLH